MTTACAGPKLSCQSPDGIRQPRIEADFSGGTITSNAGVLLAGLAAQGMGLFDRLGECFRDLRRPELTARGRRSLAGQRVLGILPGRGDLSGRGELRNDPALGAVLGRLESPAGGLRPAGRQERAEPVRAVGRRRRPGKGPEDRGCWPRRRSEGGFFRFPLRLPQTVFDNLGLVVQAAFCRFFDPAIKLGNFTLALLGSFHPALTAGNQAEITAAVSSFKIRRCAG